jgi:regulator of replication initiation timing
LIAQEVEQVLKDCGVENPGMLTITDEGMYELRYNDLLAPMIKAIQELGTENKELRTKNQELAERLSTLEAMVKSLVEKQSTETKSLGEVRMTNDE